jgi:hypothetical protein
MSDDRLTFTGTNDGYRELVDWAGAENVGGQEKMWIDPDNPETLFREIGVRTRDGFIAVWVGDTLVRGEDGELDLIVGPRDI